jgi:hypothetical protein
MSFLNFQGNEIKRDVVLKYGVIGYIFAICTALWRGMARYGVIGEVPSRHLGLIGEYSLS